MQHTLEHGTVLQKQLLCEAMLPDIGRLARHKVASHVVERALLHSGPEERRQLKEAMASNAEARPFGLEEACSVCWAARRGFHADSI